jgi:hypothetical protein
MGSFEAWITLALGGAIVVLSAVLYVFQRRHGGSRSGWLVAAAALIIGLLFTGRGLQLLKLAARGPAPPEDAASETPPATPRP